MNRKNILYRRVVRKLIYYFFQGLLFIAPISITIFILYRVFLFIDSLIPIHIPGLGLLIVIITITIFGVVGSLLVRTPFSLLLNRLLDNIPLVRILYSALKDLMSAFVGQKKKFTKPVMVQMSRDSNIHKLGFVTEEDLSAIGLEEGMVAVYLPHSYNFSGNLFVVPASNVVPLKAPATEVMKFIVSGGITRV